MAGDYLAYRHNYAAAIKDIALSTSTDWTAATQMIACKNANYVIWVQRIVLSVTTFAAKTFTFQDGAGTPVPVGFISVPAAAPTTEGSVPFIIDFGPGGFPLTQGKDLNAVMSATGVAGVLHIEAYQRLAVTAFAQSSSL